MKGKKVIFLQLPGTPALPDEYAENVPFAAGCLAAYLKIKGFDGKTAIPDHRKINRYGDRKLINFIVRQRPDWICLTLYMWNIERSFYVAARIKEKIDVKIVAGGPDVQEDNRWIFDQKSIDHFVCGEGEIPLYNLLARGDSKRIIRSEKIIQKLVSPYLEKALKFQNDVPVYIEGQRGCPFFCSFCYYPKGRSKQRFMSVKKIRDILTGARKRRCREIIFVDPSFRQAGSDSIHT